MKRWVILGAADISDYAEIKSKLNEDDYIVSADGGQKHLAKLGLDADLFIGDFDSSSIPQTDSELLKYPVEKDDTDTMLAVKIGISRGCKEFLILGGMGGRFDHTFANIQALCYADKNSAKATLCDEKNQLFVISGKTASIVAHQDEKVSLFSINGESCTVTLQGFYYPLENGKLYSCDPMGVSNFLVDNTGEITVKDGTLLVVISKENQ